MEDHRTRMDLPGKVGQLFFVGFDGTEDSASLRDFLAEVRPGGLIVFARNILDPAQMQALNAALLESAPGPAAPFISVDQEGGRVSRLRTLLPALPTAAHLGMLEEGRVLAYAGALGQALTALGFNADFAPVVDLSSPGAANGIGDRSFGEDAGRVSLSARAFIEGLAESGVASFLKHFPGLGATEIDSHTGLPVCTRDDREMWERDLRPFRECAASAAGIMTAHVHCPSFDPASRAASLSESVITGLLRQRMSYDGLAVTDDLEMGAVAGPPPGDLARQALRAGNDMVMFCNSEQTAREAFRTILDDALAGRLEETRLDLSVDRILGAKRRFGLHQRAGHRASGARWAAALDALSTYAVT